jgi:hypothetical protein
MTAKHLFMKIGGTMDKIGCGKWGAWRATLGVLLCFVVAITAQPGYSTFYIEELE